MTKVTATKRQRMGDYEQLKAEHTKALQANQAMRQYIEELEQLRNMQATIIQQFKQDGRLTIITDDTLPPDAGMKFLADPGLDMPPKDTQNGYKLPTVRRVQLEAYNQGIEDTRARHYTVLMPALNQLHELTLTIAIVDTNAATLTGDQLRVALMGNDQFQPQDEIIANQYQRLEKMLQTYSIPMPDEVKRHTFKRIEAIKLVLTRQDNGDELRAVIKELGGLRTQALIDTVDFGGRPAGVTSWRRMVYDTWLEIEATSTENLSAGVVMHRLIERWATYDHDAKRYSYKPGLTPDEKKAVKSLISGLRSGAADYRGQLFKAIKSAGSTETEE